MYIVVFNMGYRDSEFLTNSNGFVEVFSSKSEAAEEAEKWVDDKQYREFNIYEDAR